MRTIDKDKRVLKMIKDFHRRSRKDKKQQKDLKKNLFGFIQKTLQDNGASSLKMKENHTPELSLEEIQLGKFKEDLEINRNLNWKENIDLDEFFANQKNSVMVLDKDIDSFVKLDEFREESSLMRSQMEVMNCKTFKDLDLAPENFDISLDIKNMSKNKNHIDLAKSFNFDVVSSHESKSEWSGVDHNIVKSLKLDMSVNLDSELGKKKRNFEDVKRKVKKLEQNITFLKMKLNLLIEPKRDLSKKRRASLIIGSNTNEDLSDDGHYKNLELFKNLMSNKKGKKGGSKNTAAQKRRRFSYGGARNFPGRRRASFGVHLTSMDPAAPLLAKVANKVESLGSSKSNSLDSLKSPKSIMKVSLIIPPKEGKKKLNRMDEKIEEEEEQFEEIQNLDSSESINQDENLSQEENKRKLFRAKSNSFDENDSKNRKKPRRKRFDSERKVLKDKSEKEDDEVKESGVVIESLQDMDFPKKNENEDDKQGEDSLEDILSRLDEGIASRNGSNSGDYN